MPKVYFYKLTGDNGGAPCVASKLLTLAICKPMMRRKAEIGDLIFGFAANSLHKDNRLIYVACMTGKLCDGEYYKDSEYAKRSDCIYTFEAGRYFWKNGSVHHCSEDLEHDLGTYPDYPNANVLLSTDFRYFGKAASANYRTEFPLVYQAVRHLGRGHRVWHTLALHAELLRLKDWVWQNNQKMKMGESTGKPSHRRCHRGKSCGMVKR